MAHPSELSETRTFRWNDGSETDGYDAVEISRARVSWFRWSHVHGEGRIERGEQSLESLVQAGPSHPAPKPVLDELTRIARRHLSAR